MRTRTTLSMLSLLASIAVLAGCSADVSDTGSALRQVDVDAITSQTLYMVPDSLVPLTADEAAGYDEAIPVRVELLENTAVAWYAPAGEAIISRETIISLWTIVERTEISDTTAANEAPTVITTPETDERYALPTDLDLRPEFPSDDLRITTPESGAEIAILDFLDRIGSPEELPMIEELGGAHPGCI